MLHEFFYNDKGQMPSFIESVDDYPHLKIVTLRGRIDRTTLPEVEFFLKKSKKIQNTLDKNVILDLKKVTEIDTAAVAGLLKVLSTLKQKKYRLGLMNVPQVLKDQLAILKLDKLVSIFESQRKAYREILAWSEEWE